MRFSIFAFAATASIVGAGLLTQVQAQSDQTFLQGDALRFCLCLEQAILGAQNEVDLRTKAFEDTRAQLEAVKQEVATKRASLNENDPAQVTTYRQLVDHQLALQMALEQQLLPADRMAVDRYDRLVFQQRQQCQGRMRYESEVKAMSVNLVCPPQPY